MHLFLRCTAPQSNLHKTEGVTRRCQEHTELLVREFELGLLWDGWDIVGDVVVRLSITQFLFCFCFCFALPTASQCATCSLFMMPLVPTTLSPITQLYL